MSSAVYPASQAEPHNVLQMTHNMLATENVTLTQLWATTLVPTSSPVSASVMLVAPQHSGHFHEYITLVPLFLVIDRLYSPTPVEHDRHTFALTWADWANAAQFSVDSRIFLLSFRDSAMFWCFKYMALLDAFLDFKIPAEVPLGIRSGVQGCAHFSTITFSRTEHPFLVSKSTNNTQTLCFVGFLKYHDKGVSTSTDEVVIASSEYSAPQSPASEGGNHHEGANRRLDHPRFLSTAVGDGPGGMDEHVPGPTVPDIRPAAAALLATINSLHTPLSQPIIMGDSAGGTGEPNPDLIPLDVRPAADALLCLSVTDQGTSRLTVTLLHWKDRTSSFSAIRPYGFE
ncbi:hypothetical protein EDC04DRAFT_2898666 [Pisolithus marmoratus]|nr:hypothetical protein EDC04DRAFT_2898666 [Pisolithus marmoratus]